MFFNSLMTIILAFSMQSVLASEALKGAKKDLESFKVEMTTKLEKIENQLAVLKEKSKEKTSEVQAKTIQELESTRDHLKNDLSELGTATESNWKKMKSKIAKSVATLNAKVQKALQE